MAQSSNSTNKRTTTSKSNSTRSNATRSTSSRSTSKNAADNAPINEALVNEIFIIGIFTLALCLFLCNFRILGGFGNAVSDIMFGLFGFSAYIFPLIVAYIVFFSVANKGNSKAKRRSISLSVLLMVISTFGGLILLNSHELSEGLTFLDVVKETYTYSSNYENSSGGGLIGGLLSFYGRKGLGSAGLIILLLVIAIICLVLITERSFFGGVKKATNTSKRAFERSQESARLHYEEREARRERVLEERQRKLEEKNIKKEVAENEKILSMKEVSGVPTYNLIKEDEPLDNEIKERDDIHEINLTNIEEEYVNRNEEKYVGVNTYVEGSDEVSEIHYNFDNSEEIYDEDYDNTYNESYADNESAYTDEYEEGYEDSYEESYEEPYEESYSIPNSLDSVSNVAPVRPGNVASMMNSSIFATGEHENTNGGRTFGTKSGGAAELAPKDAEFKKNKKKKPYRKPPIDLLKKGNGSKAGDRNELIATARKLEEVLLSFNVEAKIDNFSQGPSVTRYELIPKTGVKVSKILSLADDLKLNLAAADIRIEAPIPGKAAVGIEVPNKESSAVAFRDLIESKEFKNATSKISFAVGKDLAGQVVVADIGKMPHMLIAGATGSGKSVCINTLIMSILYEANPDEVKMIMIDPKVVELSVYNGIPHLLIPVVTDPKKANASLAWAVREMDERYQKFAEWGVRDLKGYNEKIKNELDINGNPMEKMYQLVVIVDELADLMMVAGKEVEESICRLAQLARAAGIHLIIATQRPSVDVITGLIKANMPSRVSFAVSSGTDSRTILDMVGAEKLLGKGDMLFYPQGYTKPARVQGAFVSDQEVSAVVDFLKNNNDVEAVDSDIQEKISQLSSSSSSAGAGNMNSQNDDALDEYYIEAGRLITESGKCSIGMLQRKFKIGFNRAARIMDSLAENGVVGPEEGTKPRIILMTPEEFEQSVL
ncbi:MAG: DNA translocase FtsK [Lachnospiraceae bacterium]|nr:DNA translocase FtsK [Lachnospiraceae bacterium]